MSLRNFIRLLGPGLLYAGAAVGVSHLVQSTRAGASFGFELVWILILANILKYPFFEFGPRYAVATGNSLIAGYRRIGKWAIALFALMTLATMFATQAAVTIVTAGLVAQVFGIHLNTTLLGAIILGVTMAVLILGKYSTLDHLIKIIIVILAVSTLVAVISALGVDIHRNEAKLPHFDWNNGIHLAFLIAFIGWMPAPIDISVWHSLWSVAKRKQVKHSPTLRQSLLDFNVGYIGTALLALGFLSLGGLIMYGTGQELSSIGSVFSKQLINLYTSSLGEWSYWIIAIAALTTMFSTTLTCLDAYPRVLKDTTEYLVPALQKIPRERNWLTWFWLSILAFGTILLLSILASSMRIMVDIATTISFVTAPFLAIINYLAVTSKHMPSEAKPKLWLKIYSWIGIVFMSIFTLFYIVWRFI